MTIDKIINFKKREVEEKKKKLPISRIRDLIKKKNNRRDFKSSIKKSNRVSLIAEIKKASPSIGLIREDFNSVEIAKKYEGAGADALSVLTEERYFMGSDTYLRKIKQATKLPVLRKNFIFDPYQVYESRLLGADAILLIVSLLKKNDLKNLYRIAGLLGLDCLAEVHTYHELESALNCGFEIIGINNRDLDTFDVDINRFINLARFVPDDRILVCESGIFTRQDVLKVKLASADSVLVGTSLMTADDINKKVRELLI